MGDLSDQDFARLQSAVEDQGRRYGAARGSWVINGNTPEDAIERLIRGMEDGDPAVMDSLPELQMGEWADDPSENDIVADAAYRSSLDVDPEDIEPEVMSELMDAFRDGWYEGRDAEIYRDARGFLGPKKMRELTSHKGGSGYGTSSSGPEGYGATGVN